MGVMSVVIALSSDPVRSAQSTVHAANSAVAMRSYIARSALPVGSFSMTPESLLEPVTDDCRHHFGIEE
jgi:hypothetical protein